ncbi:hypothetical protein [Lyngbya confervoides]|uniref:Uncharacterized protein n=1 Tax=Lyngbya confervoides BDU141951 TaxID=1574623 RepID=A0ABD4T1S7_9CYAN|nr:hypothetical protein [Lyngbya confervoides]MCM1982614.1 hypothetical protein [Lyngbya confervoides BDU141951]
MVGQPRKCDICGLMNPGEYRDCQQCGWNLRLQHSHEAIAAAKQQWEQMRWINTLEFPLSSASEVQLPSLPDRPSTFSLRPKPSPQQNYRNLKVFIEQVVAQTLNSQPTPRPPNTYLQLDPEASPLHRQNEVMREYSELQAKFETLKQAIAQDRETVQTFRSRLEQLERIPPQPHIYSTDLQALWIEQVSQKYEERVQHLEQKLQEHGQWMQMIYQEYLEVSRQLQSSFRHRPSEVAAAQNEAVSEPEDKHASVTQQSAIKVPEVLSPVEQAIVSQYNKSASHYAKQSTEVSETEESQSNRRLGDPGLVKFEKKGRGNYWIISESNREYLVPSQRIRINEHNYKTIEVIFACHNYHPGGSQDFVLRKPATVAALPGGNQWQLETPGIIDFQGP